MTRKLITEVQYGDVLMGYVGGDRYEPIGTFGEYVPTPHDPKIDEAMLTFTIETEGGATYSAFYAPVGSVMVR